MTFLCDQSEDHPWVHLAKLGYKLVKYESKKVLKHPFIFGYLLEN
jgi:hypothetical protein